MIKFEPITFDNIRLGARVVNRSIFEMCGMVNCRIGIIRSISFKEDKGRTVLAKMQVRWEDDKNEFTHRADFFLIEPSKIKLKSRNPNRTFKREV